MVIASRFAGEVIVPRVTEAVDEPPERVPSETEDLSRSLDEDEQLAIVELSLHI